MGHSLLYALLDESDLLSGSGFHLLPYASTTISSLKESRMYNTHNSSCIYSEIQKAAWPKDVIHVLGERIETLFHGSSTIFGTSPISSQLFSLVGVIATKLMNLPIVTPLVLSILGRASLLLAISASITKHDRLKEYAHACDPNAESMRIRLGASEG